MYDDFKRYSKGPIKKQKDRINICTFYKDSPPFNIRLVSVFSELSRDSRYDFFMVFPEDYDKFKEDISNDALNFDYIILQRQYFDFEIAEELLKKSESCGFKIIYDIDDDLVHMDKSNPGSGYYFEIKDKLEHIISNADLVTVSTSNLKAQLSYLNDDIHVMPNRLIDAWFDYDSNQKNSRNSIKIGYMGSIYHSWDLVLIEKPVRNVITYFSKRGIEVTFELIGGTREKLDFAQQIEVPSDHQNYFHFVEWFKNTVDWDVAIAPLEYSNLNESKSELKYLEYAVLGIPGIYSDVGPYSQNIIHEKNGLLVFDNSPEEWERSIIRLIEDASLRNAIISNSFGDVESNYRISQSVEEWREIFEQNLNKKGRFNLKSFIRRFF
jgi:glycosyltransferase involved in cell wall biosynthesis